MKNLIIKTNNEIWELKNFTWNPESFENFDKISTSTEMIVTKFEYGPVRKCEDEDENNNELSDEPVDQMNSLTPSEGDNTTDDNININDYCIKDFTVKKVDETLIIETRNIELCSGLFSLVSFMCEGFDKNLLDIFNHYDGQILAHSNWNGFDIIRGSNPNNDKIMPKLIDEHTFVITFYR